MKELTFQEAWKIVKHKGTVKIPCVERKVEAAMRIVRPYLLSWEHMHLEHEMIMEPNRRGFDFVCRVIEDRLFRGIEFHGVL